MAENNPNAASNRKLIRNILFFLGLGVLGFAIFSMSNTLRYALISQNGQEIPTVVLEPQCSVNQLRVKAEDLVVTVKLHGKGKPCDTYEAGDIVPMRCFSPNGTLVRPDVSFQGRWMTAALCAIVGTMLLLMLIFVRRKKTNTA